ncbi:KpsF/GutQ family sugar-phosphate isomerase [Desulfolutivibrio sulfoxidireducens]|uniref:KpsF/GutQ family sugar-phosphate isomerase n=1 Tax=Desulfolutivibrio sulfoxidireducens TaxID=2773299 RepID=UPI00159DBAB9|nr:KpsF/GutQ family sugar-phosphate isomerase [Desulfolutivibrio sulfoxidireducens]QLA17817.1 KpsF/GutQ family sugar-phosphate isomerase [Desulfolutivibrio sulfoxidireducens]QLA21395.1 KpsF/GutQ family sugar-phosphate isomerase [Desulfolutivibrio sulfoxidireducens]
MHSLLQTFCDTIRIEAQAVEALLGHDFAGITAVVERIVQSDAKLIVTGLGKSGIIARKISATLSSTGTPSVFLHASEACHGDLGMIRPPDIVLAVSNSGETEELLRLIPYLKHNGIHFIAMTGNPQSTLARHADFHLDARVPGEACPLRLAPTSSTTAALVLGDALAMTLIQARGFQARDFAECHPGGRLGRMLLTTVEMVMKTDRLPFAREGTPLSELPLIMSEGRCGLAIITDDQGRATGIITDGDLRRAFERHELATMRDLLARDIMTPNPKRVAHTTLLADAEKLMQRQKIASLLVTRDDEIIGIVQLYDLQ